MRGRPSARDRRSTPLDTKTSKEIQPAKWDTQSCDTADLAVLDPRRLDQTGLAFRAQVFRSEHPKRSRLLRGLITQPHFPSARAQNSALKTPKSLRPAVKGASLWLRKPNFWSDPKNSELLRIFRNFFWPCTAALSRGRLNQALQLPYIGESPFIYGVGNSR